MAITKKSAEEAKASSKASKTTKKTTAKKAKKAPTYENLLIVESPAKAKTIKKYLGSKYEVLSSKGHIRDLPASRIGVDIENGFTPEYIVPRKDGKAAVIKELKAAAKDSKKVLLATDPDREGEAIAWHLAQVLGLDPESKVRVSFNEITKNAIKESVAQPRTVNMNIVNAQQSRRVLDRIVGYKLSPFLWKKVKTGLSAGRVQSVATKLVVDKEREIQAFVPVEYWLLDVAFAHGKKQWIANFFGNKDGKIAINDGETAEKIKAQLEKSTFTVSGIKRQEKAKAPKPPFTTSSLQQDASSRINMRPQKSMSVAQQLYEGVDIKGKGTVGLITYMRTDSLRISADAQAAASEYIKKTYGEEYYPKTPRVYKTKSNAQDAHEAIRPTDLTLPPEKIKDSLTTEQFKLYKLIWDRFTASQMSSAIYNTVSVDVSAVNSADKTEYILKASDSKLVFNGFTVLYNYTEDGEEAQKKLPELNEGDVLDFKEVVSQQKFTQPPSRYTEASLIKALEENGIGRPSTYAPTIATILGRRYTEKEGKALKPTALGFITTEIMEENFKNIVDVAFTADMEKNLDKVEEGETTFLNVMEDFYKDFSVELAEAEKKLDGVKIEVPNEESDVICELCGSRMVYKVSKFGRFLACPNYPTCKNTKSIVVEAEGSCPKCGGKMTVRRSKNGKVYYACEKGKDCGFMTWDLPTKETCPICGSTLFKKFGKLLCQKEGCTFEGKAAGKNE
ncbi:MAG: type I DNA topoisomerase [Clostridia bacterium]|nr:type I DNA topoisomerase [Clostridia bacterium]